MQFSFRPRLPRFLVGLFTLVALTACDLYPDAGRWAADIPVHDTSWNHRYNCAVDVDITHTEDVVSLNTFDGYCGRESLHWSPSAWTRRGSSLYLGDEEVGEVFPDGTVRVELRNPAEQDHYPNRVERVVLTWSRIGEALQFSLTEYDGPDERIFEGSLQRVVP